MKRPIKSGRKTAVALKQRQVPQLGNIPAGRLSCVKIPHALQKSMTLFAMERAKMIGLMLFLILVSCESKPTEETISKRVSEP
jgi:hypothetical protein